VKKTIIRWQVVNTRKKEKNLPRVNDLIVFKLQTSTEFKAAFPNTKDHIITSSVYEENGNLYVIFGAVKIPFSNGFVWSYLDDTEDVDE